MGVHTCEFESFRSTQNFRLFRDTVRTFLKKFVCLCVYVPKAVRRIPWSLSYRTLWIVGIGLRFPERAARTLTGPVNSQVFQVTFFSKNYMSLLYGLFFSASFSWVSWMPIHTLEKGRNKLTTDLCKHLPHSSTGSLQCKHLEVAATWVASYQLTRVGDQY